MCFLKRFLTILFLIYSIRTIICNISDEYEDYKNTESNADGRLKNQQRIIETKAEFNRIKFLSQFFKIPPDCPVDEDELTNKTRRKEGSAYCPSTNDTLACFPSVPPNVTISISCPFNENIIVNTSNIVAIKRCNGNGTWTKTDYTVCFQYVVSLVYKTTCQKVNKTVSVNETYSVYVEDVQCEPIVTGHEDQAIRLLPILFLIGYTVALVPVTLAIVIFWSFRSLRCLRNMIHSNMLLTFILKSLIFIVFKLYLSNSKIDSSDLISESTVVCLLFQVLWHYALLTSFFWMMIEGIYLISVVIAAYSSNKIKLWWYLIIGWVIPILPCVPYTIFTIRSSKVSCQWIRSNSESHNELFIDIPIYVVLAVNFILLVVILLVIIKKLRENNDAAKARYNQYRKLIRATIVLFPLLGLTYGMFFWLPKNPRSHIAKVYCYINIFFQTTQGIWVAIVYCFYNEEVKTAIKNKFRSWKSARNLHVLHQFGGSINSRNRKTSRTSIGSSLTTFTRTRMSNAHDQQQQQTMIPMLNKNKSKDVNSNTTTTTGNTKENENTIPENQTV